MTDFLQLPFVGRVAGPDWDPAGAPLGGVRRGARRTGLLSRPRKAVDISMGPQSTGALAAINVTLCLLLTTPGCAAGEIKPVDVYPEDMCAYCRMAVSDQRFACEVVTSSAEAVKFDDIGCMEKFREGKGKELSVAAVFYKDYASGSWLPVARAFIVETGLMTPMGSGKVAFADGREGEKFRAQHPPASRAAQVRADPEK